MLNEQRVFRTVRLYDPAIDWDAMGGVTGLQSWLRDGRRFERLVFREGQTPVVFLLRQIPASLALRALATVSDVGAQGVRAFRAACVGIENIAGPGSLWEPARARDEHLSASLSADLYTDAEIDHIGDMQAIIEIGDVARSLAFFPRSIEPSFGLPATSAQIWDTQAARRHAERESSTPTGGTPGARPAGS